MPGYFMMITFVLVKCTKNLKNLIAIRWNDMKSFDVVWKNENVVAMCKSESNIRVGEWRSEKEREYESVHESIEPTVKAETRLKLRRFLLHQKTTKCRSTIEQRLAHIHSHSMQSKWHIHRYYAPKRLLCKFHHFIMTATKQIFGRKSENIK